MIKLSIVVPVYNVAHYIEECLQSLMQLSIPQLEIICVNDGSTDGSEKIVERLQQNDSRIKLIHKINGGLSRARNDGMAIAQGEYMSFVDSDDWIDRAAFERFFTKMQELKLDAATGLGYQCEEGQEKKIIKAIGARAQQVRSGVEFVRAGLENKDLSVQVWLSVYRTAILKDNKLEFFGGIIHEDEEFTPRALMACQRVSAIDEKFYFYRKRASSITNQGHKWANPKSLTSLLQVVATYQTELAKTSHGDKCENYRAIIQKLLKDIIQRASYLAKVANRQAEVAPCLPKIHEAINSLPLLKRIQLKLYALRKL